MSESIVHLEDGSTADPRGTLRGAWREIGVRLIGAGAAEHLVGDGAEHAVYVWSGAGIAEMGEGSVPAEAGAAFTIVRGDEVAFRAGPEGLRLFVATFEA